MVIEASDQLEDLRMAAEVSGLEIPDLVLPTERDVILRGMRFHYLDWGTIDRRPILFLHGGGLTAHTWDLMCLEMRKNYHCLALDQRGHGDSEWSPEMDYSVEAHLRDVEAFVDHLRLNRFILVGMSMGGMNSIAYASRHSHRLAGLVLVDVGPDVRVDGARRIADFTGTSAELDSVDEFVDRAISFNPRRDRSLLRRSLLHNLRQLPNGKWTWKYDRRHRVRDRLPELIARINELWQEVPDIACPTLVARGSESDVFLDEDAEKFASALPDGRWVRVEEAGHTVQGDNPRGLVQALREFFSEIGV